MKRTLITALSLTLLFGGASAVRAEDNATSAPERGGFRQELEQAISHRRQAFKEARDEFRATSTRFKEDMKQAVEEKQNEFKNARMEFRGEVVKLNAERTVAMLNAAVERLTRITDRINARIAAVKATGASTTKAEADVAAAQTKLTDARAQIQAITNLDFTFSSSTASTTVKADLQTLRLDAKTAKEDLNAAKKSLMDAVRSLRGLGQTASSTASTTPRD